MDQWGYRAESITGAAVLLRWTSVSAAVLAEASMIGRWVSIRFNTHRLASNGLCMYVIIYMASVLCSSTLDAWLHYLVVNTHTHTHTHSFLHQHKQSRRFELLDWQSDNGYGTVSNTPMGKKWWQRATTATSTSFTEYKCHTTLPWRNLTTELDLNEWLATATAAAALAFCRQVSVDVWTVRGNKWDTR